MRHADALKIIIHFQRKEDTRHFLAHGYDVLVLYNIVCIAYQ